MRETCWDVWTRCQLTCVSWEKGGGNNQLAHLPFKQLKMANNWRKIRTPQIILKSII